MRGRDIISFLLFLILQPGITLGQSPWQEFDLEKTNLGEATVYYEKHYETLLPVLEKAITDSRASHKNNLLY